MKIEVDIPVSFLCECKVGVGACIWLDMVEVIPLLDIFTSLGPKML